MITIEDNCAKEMIISLIKDPWTYVCGIGSMLMVAADTISTLITPVVALIGSILGMLMLILGIIEKAIAIRKQLKSDHQAEAKTHRPHKK